jgi:hypothetical protein
LYFSIASPENNKKGSFKSVQDTWAVLKEQRIRATGSFKSTQDTRAVLKVQASREDCVCSNQAHTCKTSLGGGPHLRLPPYTAAEVNKTHEQF